MLYHLLRKYNLGPRYSAWTKKLIEKGFRVKCKIPNNKYAFYLYF